MAQAVISEIHRDAEAVARRALTLIAEAKPQHIALSGGSSPRPLYEMLAAEGTLAHSDVWFADERCVHPSSPDSNYALVAETIGHTARAIHRVLGEEPPDQAATIYEEELRAVVGDEPVLDLVLLGMGPDGHTASLFPDSPELEERERIAVATREAYNGFRRLTLTLPVLNRAREAIFIVTGADKAAAYARVLEGELLPAARVLGARWLLDEAAATPPASPVRRRSRDPIEGQESLFDL